MIDFTPDEEQTLIRDMVRQFAENEIRPKARSCDEAFAVEQGILDAAHELGLVANALPEAQGGGGERSAVTGCLIAEELAWGDLSVALSILSPSLLGMPVADFGSDAQKASVLPGLLGASFTPGSLAWVEPRFGFDPLKPQTTAKRDGDEYVLDGTKCFVPWQDGLAQTLVVAAEDGELAAFLVPADASGLSAEREANMGIQALTTAELTLSGVRVPASARLGEGAGADLRRVLASGRIALSAAAVGVSRAAYEISLAYAKERETFGAPIATKQAIAFKLADMATEIDATRLLAWEAAWRFDQGLDCFREATLAFQKAQRTALVVTDGSVQVFGGHGYIRDFLPEMLLRNARGFTTFEGLALL
jgi:acyl-CoA dehydrogenase